VVTLSHAADRRDGELENTALRPGYERTRSAARSEQPARVDGDRLSVDDLKKVLDYDPTTGVFRWRFREWASPSSRPWANKIWNKRFAGTIAGCVAETGYRIIPIEGRRYFAHQLAWLYVHGEFPHGIIDHISHQRDDNRISNLRDVNDSLNAKNRKLHKDNKSGVPGVQFDEGRGKWIVLIGSGGKRYNIGRFPTFDAAVAARKEAEKRFGFHRNHGRTP